MTIRQFNWRDTSVCWAESGEAAHGRAIAAVLEWIEDDAPVMGIEDDVAVMGTESAASSAPVPPTVWSLPLPPLRIPARDTA
ncbi:hypothetical protein RB199_18590 [Streptomyces libani]